MAKLDFMKALKELDAAKPALTRSVDTDNALDRAVAIAMSHEGVVGAGLGGDGSLVVYVLDTQHIPSVPKRIEGFQVVAQVTGPIRLR